MTFIEGAIEILRQNGNVPMSPMDIWKQIAKQQLVQTNGKTPWASLDTLIRIYQLNSGIGKKYLVKQNPKGIVKFIAVGTKFKLVDELFSGTTIPSLLGVVGSNGSTNGVIDLDEVESVISEHSKPEVGQAIYQIVDESLGWKRLSVYRSDTGIEYVLDDCYMFTYVLNEHTGKTVKIGKTKNDPTERLNTLRTANRGLTFNHVFPSSLYNEDALHDMFDDIRDDGEFFFYAPKLIAFLNAEKDKHTKVLSAYRKMLEAKNAERDMLSVLREHSKKSLESITD